MLKSINTISKLHKLPIVLRTYLNRWLYRRWCEGLFPDQGRDRTFVDVGCGYSPATRSSKLICVDKFIELPNYLNASADILPFDDGQVDVLFSAHCLEHCANPLEVLYEWKRVVKAGGRLVLVLPHGDVTFDRHRKKTELSHLLEDFHRKITDNDDTHWDEFKDKVLLSGHRTIPALHVEKAIENDFEFFSSRGHIHHHVWTPMNFRDVVLYLELDILKVWNVVPGRPDSFAFILQK